MEVENSQKCQHALTFVSFHGCTDNRRTYLNEEDEVFEGGVEMSLLLQLDDRVKVLVVDVGVDTEQPLQDRLRHRHEVLWERDSWDADSLTL